MFHTTWKTSFWTHFCPFGVFKILPKKGGVHIFLIKREGLVNLEKLFSKRRYHYFHNYQPCLLGNCRCVHVFLLFHQHALCFSPRMDLSLIKSNQQIQDLWKWVIFEKQKHFRPAVQRNFLMSVINSLNNVMQVAAVNAKQVVSKIFLWLSVFLPLYVLRVLFMCMFVKVWYQMRVLTEAIPSMGNFPWTWHFVA